MTDLRLSILPLLLLGASQLSAAEGAAPRIAFYGTLQSGLEEAKRSGRPIMFVSAAPQCLGVSGIW